MSYDIYGQPTQTTYDTRGEVIATTTPQGTVSDTVYDADGRVVWQEDDHVPGQQAHGTHISLIPSLARSLLQRQSGDSLGHLGENGGSRRALPLIE